MNIVLHEPEIPQNTANIGRSCVVSGARLHLIKPLGFSISEKAVRRAGLDYWKELELFVYDSYAQFLKQNGMPEVIMATTKAFIRYDKISYAPGAYIMFGKESAGIPAEILKSNPGGCVRIPMRADKRSLNLSSSVAVVLYEALRQNGFPGLSPE